MITCPARLILVQHHHLPRQMLIRVPQPTGHGQLQHLLDAGALPQQREAPQVLHADLGKRRHGAKMVDIYLSIYLYIYI